MPDSGTARERRTSRVLDTSAPLADLHQEPGWETVQAAIGESWISALNWCEVAQQTMRKGLDVARARSLLEWIGLPIVPFSPEKAQAAAGLWGPTKRNGLSLADRAFLASLERKPRVFTAERASVEPGYDLDSQFIR